MPQERGIENASLESTTEGIPAVARSERTSSDANPTLGQRLARIRRERGITQTELADKLGVPQSNISKYERDEFRLHGDLIIKISQILRVSADELLGLGNSIPKETESERRLLKRLRSVGRLPKRDQQALFRTIDAFLSKAS